MDNQSQLKKIDFGNSCLFLSVMNIERDRKRNEISTAEQSMK